MSSEISKLSALTQSNVAATEIIITLENLQHKLETLPADVRDTISDTLNLIATALEHTEETTKSVLTDFEHTIKRAASDVSEHTKIDIKEGIKEIIENTLGKELSEAVRKIDYINNHLDKPKEMSTRMMIWMAGMGVITLFSVMLAFYSTVIR